MKLPKPLTQISYPTSKEEIENLRKFHGRELRPEFMALHAINPFGSHNSPSRSVMTTQHLPAHLVVSGSEPPNPMSGLEYDLGNYTFATRMPENGKILEVIKRYNVSGNSEGVNGQPEITVIYQKEENGELDVFSIKQWESYHQHFGFVNKPTKALNTELWPGRYIPKDTVFANSPAVMEDGCYTFGVNLESVMLDDFGVAEDGVIISESAVKKFGIKVYETREVKCGKNNFPINLNGDNVHYKIFQDIGEYVRHDGLLMVTRPYKELSSCISMGPKELRTVDHIFDKKTYTRETPLKDPSEKSFKLSGKIVDIQVIKNNENNSHIPPTMTTQLDKYAKALKTYYQEILAVEIRKVAENKRMGGDGKIRISPRLQNLFVKARAITGQTENRFQGNVNLQYRRNPLDDYTVTFVVEHTIYPNLGWKFTGLSGDKGVNCDIRADKDMPTDKDGNVAEMVFSSIATVSRSNWARGFSPYFAASARNLTKELRLKLNLGDKPTILDIKNKPQGVLDEAYNRLLQFYAIVSPDQYLHYSSVVTTKEKRDTHILACVQKPVRILMASNNAINNIDAVLHLEEHFPQCFSTVTYKNVDGIMTESKRPVRIAPQYIMLLEKIADTGSFTNVGQLQHHGLLASQIESDRYSLPYRSSATRNTGCAEAQLLLFYSKSPEAIAEILDRSNNPESMREIARRLLREEKPSNIKEIIDRTVIRFGNTRPLQFLKHFLATQGLEISYMTEKEAFELGNKESFNER